MKTESVGARFRRLVGVPEPEVVYWTPEPGHPVSKVCMGCGEEKPFPDFYLSYQRGRRVTPCRACRLAYWREYRVAHAEEVRAADRRYREANREKVRATIRRWYWANRERICAEARRQRELDPEKRLAAERRWHQRNEDWVRDYERSARRRHPEKFAAREASRGLHKLGLINVAGQCEDCGGGPVELHHTDYRDPFTVVALCHRCHMRRHGAERRRRGAGGGESERGK